MLKRYADYAIKDTDQPCPLCLGRGGGFYTNTCLLCSGARYISQELHKEWMDACKDELDQSELDSADNLTPCKYCGHKCEWGQDANLKWRLFDSKSRQMHVCQKYFEKIN